MNSTPAAPAPRSYSSPEAKRRAQIARQTKRLELTEPAYRNIYAALTGKRKTTDMTATELEVVLEFLRSSRKRMVLRPAATDDECLAVLA